VASKSRLQSLTRRADFLTLKENGNIFHVNSWLLVNWAARGESRSVRCGWTIPGHIGSSVLRNRLKRWGREFLRKWPAPFESGVDLNVIMKRKEPAFYRSLEHKDFDVAMEKMVAKLQRQLQ